MVRWGNLSTILVLVAACSGAPKHTAAPVAEKAPTRVPIEPLEDDDDGGNASEDVQVQGLMGHLDRADVQPVIERSWDRVQACYSGGIGKLRYVGGQVELKFRIARDGSVKHVHVARGALGSWPVEKCVLELARAMSFPHPKGGEAEFSFPIDFPSRGHAIAMDDRVAGSELPPKLAKLGKCAQDAEDPLPGRIDVTIYVGPGGKVTSAGFATEAAEDIPETWADCAHAEATTWKLTDPRGTVLKATATWEKP
jgi:hypothetical protein